MIPRLLTLPWTRSIQGPLPLLPSWAPPRGTVGLLRAELFPLTSLRRLES